MIWLLVWKILSIVWMPELFADTTVIPYSQRNRRYSGYSTTLRGDLSHLSLAGASAGIADQFIGSIENPAGMAMTARSGGLQISGNDIQDGFIQDFSDQVAAYHYGTHLSEYPFGISAGVYSANREKNRMSLVPAGPLFDFESATSEYRLSVSRVLKNHKWSLGAGIVVGDSTQKVSDQSRSSAATGFNLGAVYQFRPRHLFGFSFTSALTFSGNPNDTSPQVSNFFQGAHSPNRIQLGYAWIPNRLFRLAAGLSVIGTSPNTGLMVDQSIDVGSKWTFHPRTGFEVTLVDFKEFWLRLGMGSYLEASRIEQRSDRLHVTGSLDATVWIFSFGWGIDSAKSYRNYLYSGGIDVVRLLQKLDLIPRPTQYPSRGLFPNITAESDEGLSRPLSKKWVEPTQGKTVFEIGKELPGKVQDKVLNLKKEVMDAVSPQEKTFDSAPGESAKPPKKSKPKRKSKKKP